jgi:dUTP pyrophosphatase
MIHIYYEGPSAPEYKTFGASGADLKFSGKEPTCLRAHERGFFKTDIHIEIPSGYEGQVRSRSGLAMKAGIMVLNSPGTIDSDYRGEIVIILLNTSDQDFWVNPGDRIAQIVFSPVVQAVFVNGKLSSSLRGEGGFGSTGVKG